MTYLQDIDLIIFDLDGTLYEDTDHFDYYASIMKQRLPVDVHAQFDEEYEKMKAGRHLVTFGKAYDANRDTIITLDPMTIEIKEVHDWNGQAWSDEKIKTVYHEPLFFDYQTVVAIGDGWWYPFVAARHFGLSIEDIGDCYNKTKEYMVTDEFQLTKTPGLKETLKRLRKEKKVILMTNSERDDVSRLLKELGLTGLFTEEITSAFKPSHTVDHFKVLLKKYEIQPHRALSVGDNFINEIAPSLKLGMKAIHVSPHQSSIYHEALTVVPTLTDILPKMVNS